jgi:hypothetical protein
MDNIPTKKELDAKAEETHALWAKANEARCIAAACEEELKDMRYTYYLAKALALNVEE